MSAKKKHSSSTDTDFAFEVTYTGRAFASTEAYLATPKAKRTIRKIKDLALATPSLENSKR